MRTLFTSISKVAALLAATLFLSRAAHAQTSTRGNDATWRVRGVSSMFKLTAAVPGKIEAFPTAPVHLRAARGEWECFQVVVKAGDKTLRDVRVEATAFATHLGLFIARDNIRIYRQHFVPVTQPSGNQVLVRKLWSDALIPIALQPSSDIAAGQSAAFWVAVKVPEDAAPGDYFSAFEVRTQNEIMRELPIVLSVSKAKMPPPTMRANVAVYYDSLRDWYSKNVGAQSNEEWQAQKKRYYQFLLDYRLNAYDLPVSWNSDEADGYLRNKRVLSVRTPPLNSPDFEVALARFKKNDALPKAYYYYHDEPQPDKYAEVRATTKRLRSHEFKVPHVVTLAPNQALQNDVDIWCANIGDFFGVGHLDGRVLEHERKAGRETWLYTMVEPKYPYPTWLLDDDASAVRVYGWMMARHGFSGFVYSMAHGWGPKPLENLQSFAATNGDGTLLYPSEMVGGVGPMPSIRLMLLRDAIEDYELLRALPEQQRTALFEYSNLNDELVFPLSQRRAWEKCYDDVRTKLLSLSSSVKVAFPKTAKPRATPTATLRVGKSATIPFVASPPQIDAKLNDKAWNDASLWRGDFVRVESDNIKIPTTKLWLAHDKKFLYVAVRASHLERAAKIAVDIAPINAEERWRFIILADGTQRIEKHTREGHALFEITDAKIARATSNEYSIVEMKIPLSVVKNAKRFRFNVSRRVYYPPSQVFYTARAFPDADDITKMPIIETS